MIRPSVRMRVRGGVLDLLKPLLLEDGVRELRYRTDAGFPARLMPSVILFEDLERETSRVGDSVTLEYFLYSKVTVVLEPEEDTVSQDLLDLRAFLIARVQQLICVPPADPIFSVVAGGEEYPFLSLGLGRFLAAPFVRFRLSYTRLCADPFSVA